MDCDDCKYNENLYFDDQDILRCFKEDDKEINSDTNFKCKELNVEFIGVDISSGEDFSVMSTCRRENGKITVIKSEIME